MTEQNTPKTYDSWKNKVLAENHNLFNTRTAFAAGAASRNKEIEKLEQRIKDLEIDLAAALWGSSSEELSKVRTLLKRVVESEAVKEAPMLSYSEAYSDALEYLKNNS